MRRFLKSRALKIFLSVFAVLTSITVILYIIGSTASPQTGLVGTITQPLQSAFSNISNSVNSFFESFGKIEELEKENADLKEKINELTESLMDYQETVNENEFYEQFLEIKQSHDDFVMQPAQVTAFDPVDPYYSFTIDCGSLDGISAHDPVITAEGLVGYVSTVAPTYSTVTTILSPSLKAGAYDRRTRDGGIVTGSPSSAAKGLTQLKNLSLSSSVSYGDYIVTSGGGGIFPNGLIIGTVSEIEQEESSSLIYAYITPAVDFSSLRDVMVITSFSGQLGINDRVSSK